MRPSYVSLQTVLFKEGLIFQDFSNVITSVSYNTRKISVDGRQYHYHRLKDELLTNPLGIVIDNGARVASLERAICDFFYLNGMINLNNKERIDKSKLFLVAQIYGNNFLRKIKLYVRQN